MATIGNVLTGVSEGLGQGFQLGQRALDSALRMRALRNQERRADRAALLQGVTAFQGIMRMPPGPGRNVALNRLQQATGVPDDFIKEAKKASEEQSAQLSAQLEAMARQFPGARPFMRAFANPQKFMEFAARQEELQSGRVGELTLGRILGPSPSVGVAAAPQRGVIAATEPTQTETLTSPVPTAPPIQPNVQQARVTQLQEALAFFNTPQGRQFQRTEAGKNAQQNIRDELTALTGQQQRGMAQARAQREEQRTISREQRQAARDLRKEFTQVSKTFRDVGAAYGRVQASLQDPSPAGDIALVFAYMKMLDPTSVVREGEQATARNAGSVPDRIRNMYNRLLTGELFGGERSRIRQDFANRARLLFDRALQDQKLVRQQFQDIATRQGVDPRDVLLRFRQQRQGGGRGRQVQPPGGARDAPPSGRLMPETQQRINNRFNK